MSKTVRLRLMYIACDLLMSFGGMLVFSVLRFAFLPPHLKAGFTLDSWLWHDSHVLSTLLAMPLIMVMFYGVSGFYNDVLIKSRLDDLRNSLMGGLVGTLLVYFAAMIDDYLPNRIDNYELLLILWASLSVPVFIGRSVITAVRRRIICRMGGLYRAVIIGDKESCLRLEQRLATPRHGIPVFNIVDRIESPARAADIVQRIDAIAPQAVIIASHADTLRLAVELIGRLVSRNLSVYATIELYNLITSGTRITSVVSEPLIDISHSKVPPATANIKRIIDVVASASALVVLSPVFAAVALAVKLGSSGPVFYSQSRVGRHYIPFKIHKFRTMVVNAEANGPRLSTPGDPRITRVGAFLRKYRLDELPQFWNVLRGDMSLVGPRPEREYFVTQLIEREPYYSLLYQMRPGLTSWGVVKYGYASNIDQMLERLPYDLLYLENMSLSIDLKILFHTVSTIITGKGM